MRVLLFGKNGRLGWELQRTLAPLGEVIALGYPQLDLSQPERVAALIREERPDIIVNAAAYTAVDRAESEPHLAMQINGRAPGVIAEAAISLGAALIHYSTDYVFDGAKRTPYTEADLPNPLGAYGDSKLAGEGAIEQVGGAYIILRSGWMYSLRCDSFVTKVLTWARQNPQIRIVSDQTGSPTWARLLAEMTAQLLAIPKSQIAVRNSPFIKITDWFKEYHGLYHLAGSGAASRLEWAKAILQYDPHPQEQLAHEVLPVLTTDFPTPARRPLYSALDCTRFNETFGLTLPDWESTLQLAME